MRKLTATQIKVIAIIAMTIDHIGYMLIPAGTTTYYILRHIGKLTAPLMCFFLAEGFRHTHDKRKYLLRMLMFAIISQPAYFLLVYGRLPHSIFEFLSQMNVIVNLSITLICLLLITNEKHDLVLRLILAAVVFSLAEFCDWSYMIPIWTFIFFFFNKDKRRMALAFSAASLFMIPILFSNYTGITKLTYALGTILALVPINLYNGERDRSITSLKRKINRWFFYVYYPLHMILIFFIYSIHS